MLNATKNIINANTTFLLGITVSFVIALLFPFILAKSNLSTITAAFLIISTGILSLINPFYGISLLLIYVPFHSLLISVFLTIINIPVTDIFIFSFSKEIMLFVVLSTSFMQYVQRVGKYRIGNEIISLLTYVIIGTIYILPAPDLKTGLYGFRNLFEGIVIGVVVMLIRPSRKEIFNLINILIIEAVIISIWGIVQVYTYDEYLQDIGFMAREMSIEEIRDMGSAYFVAGVDFQRAISIFVGPNELAYYLSIFIIFGTTLLITKSNTEYSKYYLCALFLMLICMIHTFSRSCWLILVIFFTSIPIKSWKPNRKYTYILLFGLPLLCCPLLIIPIIRDFIISSLTLSDASSIGHYMSFLISLDKFLENPFGAGLGVTSYVSGLFVTRDTSDFHTEIYLFVIAIEMGIIGILSYLGVITFLIVKIKRYMNDTSQIKRLFSTSAYFMIVGTLASQTISVISYNLFFQYYFWFFICLAIYINKSKTVPEQHNMMRKFR